VTLKNKPGTDHDQAKLAFKKDAGLTVLVDPRCGSGRATTLTLASSADDLRAIALPCEYWAAKGTGFVYRDKTAAHGGVRQVKYAPGTLQVDLRGPAYASIDGPVAALELGLEVGTTAYCGRFATFTRNDATSVVSKGPSTSCADDGLL